MVKKLHLADITGICEVVLRQSSGTFQTVTPLYTIINSDNLQYNKVGPYIKRTKDFCFHRTITFWILYLILRIQHAAAWKKGKSLE